MPRAALKPCKYPGCPELVERGCCEEHAKIRSDMRRGSNVRDPRVHRLYGTKRWQLMRERQLAMQPWCELCLSTGIYTEATDVHHVERHEGDSHKFNNSPLQSLCHPCHSKKTAAEVRGEVGRKSFSLGGTERRGTSA